MYSTWAHLGFNALTCAQPKSKFQKIYGKGDLWTALKCKLTSFTALEVLTLYELYIIMYQPTTKFVNYFLKGKSAKKALFYVVAGYLVKVIYYYLVWFGINNLFQFELLWPENDWFISEKVINAWWRACISGMTTLKTTS